MMNTSAPTGIRLDGVSWELQAPTWKDLEESFGALTKQLPNLGISWAKQGKLPCALPALNQRWMLTLQHTGIGPVNSAGMIHPSQPFQAMIVMAGLRTDRVAVGLADEMGNAIGLLDDSPHILELFQTNIEEVRECGGEIVGLISKRLRIVSTAPSFFF